MGRLFEKIEPNYRMLIYSSEDVVSPVYKKFYSPKNPQELSKEINRRCDVSYEPHKKIRINVKRIIGNGGDSVVLGFHELPLEIIKSKIITILTKEKIIIDPFDNRYTVTVRNMLSKNNDDKKHSFNATNDFVDVFNKLKKAFADLQEQEKKSTILFGDSNERTSHHVILSCSGNKKKVVKGVTKTMIISLKNYSSTEIIDMLKRYDYED